MLHRAAALITLGLVLAACGGGSGAGQPVPVGGTEAGAASGEGITVVTTVFPLASMAEEIAPGADVRLLTSSGQDPHDLELSPGDRALLETADVVLYMGDLDFQPQVESAVADATGEVVAVSDVVGAGNLRAIEDHDDDGHGHDDSDDDGHGPDDGHGHDDGHDDSDDDDGHDADAEAHDGDDAHDDEGVDPHIWFDAGLMAEVAEGIGEALAAVDAGAAADYRADAGALGDELRALDEELDALFDDCARETALVSHEAYIYLLEPRGLEQEGISGAGGHGGASPQRLAELTDRVRDESIPAVLVEPLEGRADAESLANEAEVELIEIDPLEIGSPELLAVGYAEALRQQAQAFATALECSEPAHG